MRFRMLAFSAAVALIPFAPSERPSNADPAGPSRSVDTGRSVAVVIDASAPGAGVSRLELRGLGGVRARESRSPDGAQVHVDLEDPAGRRLGSVTALVPGTKRAEARSLRILDRAGEELAMEHVAWAARTADAAAPAPADDDASSTLTWRDADGGTMTFVVSEDVALELETAAPQAASDVPRVPRPAAPSTSESVLSFELMPPRPNPFEESTAMRFSLPRAGHVSIAIFDLAGRRVATLLDEPRAAGVHTFEYRPGALPLGQYFVRLTLTNSQGTITRTASRPIVHLR